MSHDTTPIGQLRHILVLAQHLREAHEDGDTFYLDSIIENLEAAAEAAITLLEAA